MRPLGSNPSLKTSKSSSYFLFSAALLVYLLACWKNLFFLRLIPLDGNVMRWTYPHWCYFQMALRTPRQLLWNPLANMGEPFLADPQAMAAYPVLWLLHPLSHFLSFMQTWVILHTLLAAVMMALLAYRWYGDFMSALAAGLVFGFNGFFTARLSLPNHFAAAAYLPAVLYFLDRESAVGFGGALALQWAAGFPPFFLLSAFFAGLLAIHKGKTSQQCFIKGGTLALGLTAIQWLPFWEMLRQSSRPLFLHPDIATQFSIPGPQLLKEVLLPQWYSYRPAMTGDPAMTCFYVGVVAIGLALWGFLRGTTREKRLAGCVAGALLLSMGSHLPGYDQMIFLHVFRFPANWLLGACLGFSLLCASGMRHLPNLRWKGVALSLLALDLLLFCQYTRVAWFPPSFLENPPDLVQMLQTQAIPTRIFHLGRLDTLWTSQGVLTIDEFSFMKEMLLPSYGTSFDIPEARSYQTLRSLRAESFQNRLEQARPESPLWDRAGISLIIRLSPGAERVDRNHVEVWQNKHPYLPLYFPEGTSGQIQMQKITPGAVDATVNLQKPGQIVYREVYYPGWRAAIDGSPAKLETFEDTFLELSLNAGHHQIEFTYRPVSVCVGLGISLTALLFLLVRIWI